MIHLSGSRSSDRAAYASGEPIDVSSYTQHAPLLVIAVRVILVAGAICGVFDGASAIGVLGFFGVRGVRL